MLISMLAKASILPFNNNFKSTRNKIKLFKGSFGVIVARDPVEIEAIGQNHQITNNE